MKKSLLCMSAVLMVQACSSYNPTYPTFESDFIDGKPKTLNQYDLQNETFPCGLLSHGSIRPDSLFIVEGAGVKFQMTCRDVIINGERLQRGIAFGTKVDCNTRTWDYSNSLSLDYKRLAYICNN